MRNSQDNPRPVNEPFFHELHGLTITNDLYKGWMEYTLSLTADDVKDIVNKGLTHQATALKQMIRQLIGGQRVPRKLLEKLEAVVTLTARQAARLN